MTRTADWGTVLTPKQIETMQHRMGADRRASRARQV
jgi:hypothetical protein